MNPPETISIEAYPHEAELINAVRRLTVWQQDDLKRVLKAGDPFICPAHGYDTAILAELVAARSLTTGHDEAMATIAALALESLAFHPQTK